MIIRNTKSSIEEWRLTLASIENGNLSHAELQKVLMQVVPALDEAERLSYEGKQQDMNNLLGILRKIMRKLWKLL
jgi:hypothetical protein